MMEQWDYPNRIEIEYQRALQRLVDSFTRYISGKSREIAEILNEPVLDVTNPADVIKSFSSFIEFDSVKDYLRAASSRMITAQAEHNAKTWRQAASLHTKGPEIRTMLMNEMLGPLGYRIQSLIDENQKLISTFADDLNNKAAEFVTAETLLGRRAEGIARDLIEQYPDISRSRLTLIARTETSKASTTLTRARADYLNLPWYEWRTSRDIRVRESHRHMMNVLVNWNDAPSPEALKGIKSNLGHYHAGCCPNCRCFARCILDIHDISWPHKVYYGGTIQLLTLKQFRQISGMEVRNAA